VVFDQVARNAAAAEAPAAVDDDALAGNEPGAFGGEEADGVGDVELPVTKATRRCVIATW
jgi:hypothetical protein